MEVCFFQKKISLDCFGGFLQKKNTILQNSLKRKCNHDAKPSEQLNHFYLDFISQALMIYREWEVRGNHILSFLPFSPTHKHSEVDLQVCNFCDDCLLFYDYPRLSSIIQLLTSLSKNVGKTGQPQYLYLGQFEQSFFLISKPRF